MQLTIYGIDISHWNKINWDKVKADSNIRFVYIKATQGTQYVDDMMESHRQGAIYAGKDFGFFGFLDYFNYTRGFEIEHGIAQAEHLYAVTKSNPGQLPLAIDTETNEGANWHQIDETNVDRVLKICLAFYNRLYSLTGRLPINYNSAWIAAKMHNFKGGQWIPRYKTVKKIVTKVVNGKMVETETWVQPPMNHMLSEAELATYPKPTVPFKLWQYNSVGPYGDSDVFNGSEKDYALFLGNNCVPTHPDPDPQPADDPVIGKIACVISQNGVWVRVAPGTGSDYVRNFWGTRIALPTGTLKTIIGVGFDSLKNRWLQIGEKQWICENYNGSQLCSIL